MMGIMDFIIFVVGCVAAVFFAVATKVLSDDAKSFIPRLAQNLLRRASLRLGEQHADSFYEEWSAHANEIPEVSGRMWHAATIYLWGSYRIRRILVPELEALEKYHLSKRALDLLIAIIVAPLAVTIILICALLISLDGRSPFESHMRLGLNGRHFRVWHLRTMYTESHVHVEGRLQESDDTPNVFHFTTLGLFLLRTSLHLLPEVWNVFNGTMSVVGPRPLSARLHDQYTGKAYYKTRPGLCGVEEITIVTPFSLEYHERVTEKYTNQPSLMKDLKFIFDTAMVVVIPTWKNDARKSPLD